MEMRNRRRTILVIIFEVIDIFVFVRKLRVLSIIYNQLQLFLF